MTKRLIVSRHPATVAYLRDVLGAEWADAPVLASATAEDVTGAVVVGNLPLHLAALAAEVIAVEFAGDPPRGAEYGRSEMEAAGVRLARYAVQHVPLPYVLALIVSTSFEETVLLAPLSASAAFRTRTNPRNGRGRERYAEVTAEYAAVLFAQAEQRYAPFLPRESGAPVVKSAGSGDMMRAGF